MRALMLVAALLALAPACGSTADSTDSAQGVKVDAETVKKLAVAGRQIKKDPASLEAILGKLGMDQATYEATLYSIALSPKASAQYAEAFASAKGGSAKEGGGKEGAAKAPAAAEEEAGAAEEAGDEE